MIISRGFLPIYFGCLGLCYILGFGCMLLLQWRKQIYERRRAKAWVKQLKAEAYFQRALDHTAKKAQPGRKTKINIPAFDSIPNPPTSSLFSEITANTSDSFTSPFIVLDPCKPVFQEVPCACVLPHLPPLLEHSASYPCSSIPPRSSPFNSLMKPALLKNESYNPGSSISA